VKLAKHDPYKALLDEKLIAEAFWECLKENDPEGAAKVISAHLNALKKFKKDAPQVSVGHPS